MKNVIIIILAVLVIGLSAYIVADKVLENRKTDDSGTTIQDNSNKEEAYNDFVEPSDYVPKMRVWGKLISSIQTDVDVTKYNNIFEYIEKQDNVSIGFVYCTGEDYNNIETEGYSGQYTFTDTEVKTILSEMKKSTQEIKGGLGGVCVPMVKISYTRNGVSKYLNLYSVYAITETNDGNIYKIYDKNVQSTDDTSSYLFQNLSETLKNKIVELANRY